MIELLFRHWGHVTPWNVGMHHLLIMPLLLGIFQIFFFKNCSCLMVSGVITCMVGYVLTLWCNWQTRKNINKCLRQIHPAASYRPLCLQNCRLSPVGHPHLWCDFSFSHWPQENKIWGCIKNDEQFLFQRSVCRKTIHKDDLPLFFHQR